MRGGWGPGPRRRPPWWPEGEGWPPPRPWGRRGPPFLLLIGCSLLGVFVLGAIAIILVAGLIAITPEPLKDAILASSSGVNPLLFVVVPLILIFVLTGAARGMRRMTRPMGDLVEAAGRIEAGDYSARVAESGPRQLRSVARAFNEMSARLKSTDEQRRSFLADVAHELRTPLSVIRGQAEAISDGVYPGDTEHIAPIVEATRTLEVLVEDLRTLVLTDVGSLSLHREAVDLAVLAHDALASFQAQAETAGVTLAGDTDDGVQLANVDPARIRSVLGNLLSNAIRHTPAGGSVRVAVESSGPQVVVTVTDTGEGIPRDLLPHVLERFVRGPESTGSGLGLAIAHDIVVAHGGTIQVESKPGSGTTVRLSLPAAAGKP